ncbi:MAG: hypothetical protein JWO81_97 [Alphaproteobacteria bacterium]|nr:hypothetical protein [Alphaproteobacteria bacterium]
MNMIVKIAPPGSAQGFAAMPAPASDIADRTRLRLPAAAAANDDAAGALSLVDRGAILVSRTDGRGSLTVTSARTWLGTFFGFRQPSRLAGDRFEALRRYALLYRLEGAGLSFAEDKMLLRAGLSERDLAAVRAIVDAAAIAFRTPTRRRLRSVLTGGLLLSAALLSAWLLDAWLARQVDDGLSALMVAIMMVTGIVSMLAVSAHPGPRGR